jgi:hypothetical protein
MGKRGADGRIPACGQDGIRVKKEKKRRFFEW